MNEKHPNLETLRKELQELDLQILLLLMERFTLSQKMGAVKKQQSMDIFQETEWQRKIGFLGSHLEGHPFSNQILKVFYLIHNESLDIQQKTKTGFPL